ncbi:MAG TPA: DNA topoisomerase IB [Vicinamibacteria bacterium]|nr:DNA topoisomerase IB [Vicinamibacteria bacterium]
MHRPRSREPWGAAHLAGLRYVSDARPGIRRVRSGRAFRYLAPSGRPIRAASELNRIRALAVPPAWTDVWICADPDGHLQATGRDARGRKQYRYHPRFRDIRDSSKYGRMLAFARALPAIRARVRADLDRRGLPREKVAATVVQLLETTLVRVGNEEYARANRSYGLTTLRDGHARIGARRLRFRFRGKSGKVHEVAVSDPRLARIVRACRAAPGPALFQYRDARGRWRPVESADVNAYLRAITGRDFTAKDFRTWAATVMAACALLEAEVAETRTAGRRAVKSAVEAVADRLGNTAAICRRSYVHPVVVNAYLEGRLRQECRKARSRPGPGGLDARESRVLRFLARAV